MTYDSAVKAVEASVTAILSVMALTVTVSRSI